MHEIFPSRLLKFFLMKKLTEFLPENTSRVSLEERSEIIRNRNIAAHKILGL